MICIDSQIRYTNGVKNECIKKAICLTFKPLTRLTSFAYSLICLFARFVTTSRTASLTGLTEKHVQQGMGLHTWSRRYLSESGQPQAFLLSELRSSSMGRHPLSLRSQKRLAQLKSAAILLSRMVWRWL